MLRVLAAAFALLASAFLPATAHAAFGALDTTFGTNGVATVDFSSDGGDMILSVVVDDQDRIYALAKYSTSWVVLRFTADGDPDLTFGSAGQLVLEAPGTFLLALAVDPQGRFLAASSFDGIELFRYTAAGELDDTFSTDGIAHFADSIAETITSVGQIQVRSDGRIMVGTTRDSDTFGNKCFYPVRFTAAGDPDTTFDGDGGSFGCAVGHPAHELVSLAAGPNGRTLAGGFGNSPGNRQATFFLLDDAGTYEVSGRSLGYGGASAPEAATVAIRYLAGSVSFLMHSVTGGKPTGFMAASGTGIAPVTGSLENGTPETVVSTSGVPAAWLATGTGTGSYALQRDGSIILGGRMDDLAGDTNAAILRFEGSPQLAVPTGGGGGGGGGGGLPLSALGLLALAALARRSSYFRVS